LKKEEKSVKPKTKEKMEKNKNPFFIVSHCP
jgi:hypothetical protein